MPVHEHGIAVTNGQLLLLSIGLPENGQVREYHDGARNPERNGTGDDHVNLVNYKLASVRIGHSLHPMFRGCVPA